MKTPKPIVITVNHCYTEPKKSTLGSRATALLPSCVLGIAALVYLGVDPRLAVGLMSCFALLVGTILGALASLLLWATGQMHDKEIELIEAANEHLRLSNQKIGGLK